MSYCTSAYYESEDYCSALDGPPDEDTEREADNYGRTRACTCGYLAAIEAYDRNGWIEDSPSFADFAGCTGCDPVDHESMPRTVATDFDAQMPYWKAYHGTWRGQGIPGLLRPQDATAYMEASRTHSRRRFQHAEIMWGRICDESTHHKQAVRRFRSWAHRASTIRYRDDK